MYTWEGSGPGGEISKGKGGEQALIDASRLKIPGACSHIIDLYLPRVIFLSTVKESHIG